MPPVTLPRFELTGWAERDLADPYPIYRRYRDLAPVHVSPGLAPDEPDTHYAFGHAAVTAALTDRAFLRNRPDTPTGRPTGPIPAEHRALRAVVENWLVFLDPPRHTALRSHLAGEFTPGVVTALRPRIAEIAHDLLEPLARRTEFDLVAGYAAPLPVLVIAELLGLPRADHHLLRAHSVTLQEAGTTRPRRPGRHRRAEAAARALTAHFTAEITRRETEARGGDGAGAAPGDLLGLLLRARARGADLPDAAVVGTCVHLLTAGHETTANFLAKAVLTLSRRPETLAALRAGAHDLPRAVEELLRFDPPVQAVTRWAGADTHLDGHEVPRGSRVVALLGSAGRDPAHRPDPDRLDLDRAPDRTLAFGLGVHYCLGAGLARAEAELGLRALLTGPLAADRPVRRVTWAPDLVFHGPSHLTLGPGGPA
ncbi:cytochrome P450 (plasmid) [Streptomyces sp. BI20]|uniref:cytochrome P450 n=1 Tax=Streptomyces sp. BI20 TaxID=3403460 RepID=UPI003C73FF6B